MSYAGKIANRALIMLLLASIPHLAGCAAFGLVMMGPIGVAGAPILAVYGFFFLPIEWLASFAQFFVYSQHRTSFRAMLIVSMICASLFTMIFGPKDPSEGIKMVVAYAASGAAAAAASAFLIRSGIQNDKEA